MKKFLLLLSLVCVQQINAQVTFPATNYNVGFTNHAITSADFNSDGKLDLVIGSYNGGGIVLLLGNGLGGFGAANIASPKATRCITTADFNSDGKADIAIPKYNFSGSICILFGDGAGNFPSADSSIIVGTYPWELTTSDFNGDGKPDLAVTNSNSNNVSVVLNNGTGGFNAAANFPLSSSPTSICCRDFNMDGFTDLAVAISGNVSILLGNGTGSFNVGVNYVIGTSANPNSLCSADFNGDGFYDIASANSSYIDVILNNGTGGFGSATTYTAGSQPSSIVSVDLNADGKPDLAVADYSNKVSTLIGTGTGNFALAVNTPVLYGPWSITSADFNADGNPDLATANQSSNDVSVLLCSVSSAILGVTYKDNNGNCKKDGGDINLKNIPINLYDNSNNFLGKAYSFSNGDYFFAAPVGTYTAVIDTAGMPFMAQCIYPGLDSTVVINGLDSNINFSLVCKPGFDAGVQSVMNSPRAFPGQLHTLSFVVGDMTQHYNLNCLSGISGQVQATVSGPVTYIGPAPGALTPSVAGNVFTYTIANFGAVNNTNDFAIILRTDTTAQVGDTICVLITVAPLAGDIYPVNNTYHFCYTVRNSHDPNLKEVYPVDVQPGYSDWFIYTIHFQNTGTAAAINIKLTDMLDANLDASTFQMINYSHANTTLLNGNFLTVKFPNINLPDSTSNLSGSNGFIQYRVKPKTGLLAGTQIKNTANIYFDYNPAVVTNTTVNNFQFPAGIKEQTKNNVLHVYPNPAKDILNMSTGQTANTKAEIKITNVLGEEVMRTSNLVPPTSQIDVSQLQNGIYFITLKDLQQNIIGTKKIIVQH